MHVSLNTIASASLILSALSADVIALDVARHPQPMKVMNLVSQISALYAGPLALAACLATGRGKESRESRRPLGVSAMVGSLHCGAGCALAMTS